MDILTENIRKKIDDDERYRAFQEFQQRLERQGVIPRSPRLMLRKYSGILHSVSEILLGTFIGGLTLVLILLVVNKLLHIEFQ